MISYFKNNKTEKPEKELTLQQFLTDIKSKWKLQVEKLRETQSKKLKDSLPAVTISGTFKTRAANFDLSKKIIAHSGFICIDIDSKDNPRMSTSHVIDHECIAQFVSCRGEGLKIIYACKKVTTQAEHWRVYDAVVERLQKKKVNVKVDSIVKSIISLQYVTYDPDPYINLKSKLVVKPLAPIKLKKREVKVNSGKELEILAAYVKQLSKKDITNNYETWNNIAFGLSFSLGEDGREVFHQLSKNYKGYSTTETDEKYDHCLQRQPTGPPITIATVYDIIAGHVPKLKIKKDKGVAIGTGQGEECPDMAGMVQYKLFLFKKHLDKETLAVKALTPHALNPLAFGKLLMSKNIYRYENAFVKINNAIVEKVDTHTILWEISEFIKQDGNYDFTYKGEQYSFSWEDVYYLWSVIKMGSGIYNAISTNVAFWVPNLIADTPTVSYVPYLNGVVEITGKSINVTPYSALKHEIWKDEILPRNYKPAKKAGMFEIFFADVMGKLGSEEYRRALWYYGYMLQGTKDPATARAWMLYDIAVGNNGRSGKSLIGQALGYIRHVTTIDGKQVDFRNRFWLQTIKPWTKIIFIDDPKTGTSILPMFNMITGTVTADRKTIQPLEVNAKFLFASNWIMESDGSSEADRQFISQLTNYYTEYSRKHGNTITPLVHRHGKRFFTEWNELDWQQFDTFSLNALQYHLKAQPPTNIIIGNSRAIQFKQRHGEEIYDELQQQFEGKRMGDCIARDVLISFIRDRDNQVNAKHAGAIARDFLKSVGCKNVTVTTIRNKHGIPTNVYKWEK